MKASIHRESRLAFALDHLMQAAIAMTAQLTFRRRHVMVAPV